MNIHVTKKSTNVELYSSTKYTNCLELTLRAAGYTKDQKSKIISDVMNALTDWLKNKNEVSSLDIYSFTEKYLSKHYKKAALVYKKYQDIW